MKTHWKKLRNKYYIGAHDLDNGGGDYREVTATIKEVSYEKGKTKEEDMEQVVYFNEVKPLILNVTNGRALEKMYGKYIEDWVGKKVTLYVKKRVKAFGSITDAIRIKAEQPAPPLMDENNALFAKILERVKGGTATIEQVEKSYTLSPNAKKQLTDARPK